mgnify:CR=1 FL=1
MSILGMPDNKSILDAVETVNKCYEILTAQQILVNGKKLPVQLGEWYAKCIFGLHQKKSTSQRGFDFYFEGENRLWKHLQFIGILTGFFWVVVVWSNVIALCYPKALRAKWAEFRFFIPFHFFRTGWAINFHAVSHLILNTAD